MSKKAYKQYSQLPKKLCQHIENCLTIIEWFQNLLEDETNIDVEFGDINDDEDIEQWAAWRIISQNFPMQHPLYQKTRLLVFEKTEGIHQKPFVWNDVFEELEFNDALRNYFYITCKLGQITYFQDNAKIKLDELHETLLRTRTQLICMDAVMHNFMNRKMKKSLQFSHLEEALEQEYISGNAIGPYFKMLRSKIAQTQREHFKMNAVDEWGERFAGNNNNPPLGLDF